MKRADDLGFRLAGDSIECPRRDCDETLTHDGGGPDFDWWWCPRCGREYRSTSHDPNQGQLLGETS